jgi:hypothetical protein
MGGSCCGAESDKEPEWGATDMKWSAASAILIMLGAFAATAPARADSECAKGYRDTTPAEKAAMRDVLAAVRRALPPAPAGWVLLGDEQLSVPNALCRDVERSPWFYQFTRNYQRTDDQEARNKIIADAADKSAAAMKLKQPRLDAIMAKMTKLSEQQGAAAQKGDLKRAEAIGEDIDKLQEEYKKVADEGDSGEQFAAAADQAGRDMTMNIEVQVNGQRAMPGPGSSTLPLPPGASAAFRWSPSKGEDKALILFGDWKRGREGSWESSPRARLAMASAHDIAIYVTADASRIATTLKSIDFATVAKLASK